MHKRFCLIFFGLCITVMSSNALAEPDRSSVKSDLSSTLSALETAAKEQEKLQVKRAKMGEELSSLQEELVRIAATIQSREKMLLELEDSTTRLTRQEKALSADLDRRRKEMDDMLMGMMKLSIVPPEMVLAMPGDFDETLRTAKVLGLTSSAIRAQAETLRRELEEARELRERISAQTRTIENEQAALQKNQQSLEQKLSARGKIQEKLVTEQKQREREVRKLSEDSKNLRDLLTDLEKRWQDEAKKAQKLAMIPQEKPSFSKPSRSIPSSPVTKDKPAPSKPSEKALERPGLPAEGKVFVTFGDKTDSGEPSRGIRIRTRGGASVTAPYAGEVVYTGPFLEYGNLIIIRHEGKYHSLLAGVSTIQCKLGQKLLKGEPVGRMGEQDSSTALYVEIRRNNKPIDPLPWLSSQKLAGR